MDKFQTPSTKLQISTKRQITNIKRLEFVICNLPFVILSRAKRGEL